MRVVMIGALAACVACTGASEDRAAGVSDPTGDQGAAPECVSDGDCVAAASTCCECPSFALPASSGWGAACGQVTCPPAPACGGEVHAACQGGACRLACVAIACDRSCAAGFAIDAAGCQACACADPAPPQCTRDDECVRVAADCCGCAKGGADTAIAVADRAQHDAALGCTGTTSCPGVDVCVAGQAARCRRGACVLADDPSDEMLPAGACGRPDLPACAAGLRCMLNANNQSAAAGVGVCAP